MSGVSVTQSRSRGQKEQLTLPCYKPTDIQKWHRCCDYITLNLTPPPWDLKIGESHPLSCPAHMQQQRLGRSNTGAHHCCDLSWCLTGDDYQKWVTPFQLSDASTCYCYHRRPPKRQLAEFLPQPSPLGIQIEVRSTCLKSLLTWGNGPEWSTGKYLSRLWKILNQIQMFTIENYV